MTRHRREIETMRLIIEHPSWTAAQIESVLALPPGQLDATLLRLEHRGAIERTATGWQRRRSDVRAWRAGA